MTLTRKIFSGIQPTGVPHFGNYLGAMKTWLALQNHHDATQVLFSIVDLHALTIPKDPQVVQSNLEDTAISLLAVGLDPKKCIMFQQSKVPGHSELCWILSCLASTGQMGRMHQWKAKEQLHKEKSSLGLLSYPVLMAADVLLYKTTHVPVGEDQLQHLELTRDLARLFNNKYGNTFPEPVPILATTCRVMNLQDPTKKMSKSDATNRGRIELTDSPDDIKSKIRKSVTDSISYITYDPKERPGVANLINMYSALSGLRTDEIVDKYKDEKYFTKTLKSDLTDAVVEELGHFRAEFDRLSKEKEYVRTVLKEGWKKANEIAVNNIKEIRKLLGLEF